MGPGPRRPPPVARTRRCAFILENLNLQKATRRADAVYEDMQIEIWNETAFSRLDNKSRQGGLSFAYAMDALAAGWLEGGTICNFSSYNREETAEKIRYVKDGIKALWPGVRPEIIKDNVYELEIDNGSRFIGWPAKPPRGKGQARYYIDEWAHIHLDEAIRRAASGGIGRGGIVRGGSTPLGQRGVFHEIYTEDQEYRSWVRGRWPWWLFYGLCIDVERARREAPLMSTEDRVCEFGTLRLQAAFEDFGSDLGGFQQEYECEFWDDEGAFLPMKLIMSCEADYDLEEAVERELPIGLGIDVGRDKSRTAVIGLQRQKVLTTVLIDIMHKVPFPQQEERIAKHIEEFDAMRTCIDRGGMGRALYDYVKARFGASRVEGVKFTQDSKEVMMTTLKALFEKRQIVIPAGDKKLRSDLNKIRQIPIKGGGYRYYADMDDSGHADRAWALALAIRAAGKAKRARGLGQKVVRSGRRRSGW